MSTQSSAAMAFRALVMLTCLVVIPLAALFGTTLPDMIRQILQHQFGVSTASAAASPQEAPRFIPTAPVAAGPGPVTITPETANPVVIPVAFQAPAAPVLPGAAPIQRPEEQRLAAAGPEATISLPLAQMPLAGVLPPSGDHFCCILDRLRQLGSTYYVLDTLGTQGQVHRFYCKMAMGGSANYTRNFEAIEADPLRAMSRVLEQVESWRAGRP